jgi:hypothetical protein
MQSISLRLLSESFCALLVLLCRVLHVAVFSLIPLRALGLTCHSSASKVPGWTAVVLLPTTMFMMIL